MATKNTDLITKFDDIQLPTPGASRSAVQGIKTERDQTPTQYWVNVGVRRGDKLVSLPMGIPLDKLQPRKIPGASTKNPEFRYLRLAEVDLWNKVQKIMAGLKPGETVVLPFEVELRRVEENEVTEEELSSSENPFAVGDLGI